MIIAAPPASAGFAETTTSVLLLSFRLHLSYMAVDTEKILEDIEEHGFYYYEDATIGGEVDEVVKFQLFSE